MRGKIIGFRDIPHVLDIPMSTLIKFLPGFIAAVLAYIALQLMDTVGLGLIVPRWLVFFGVYVFVALTADRALIEYGRSRQS